MAPLTNKLTAVCFAAAGAGLLAYVFSHIVTDSRVTLSLGLAAYGVIDALLQEAGKLRSQRRLLRESLESFFEGMRNHRQSQPLWGELQRRIAALIDIESGTERRERLRAALAESNSLARHVSFLALEEHETPCLRALKKSMELPS